jgi:hypothetical protein
MPTHRRDSAPRRARPAIGDKRVSDQRPDACFDGRMLHTSHARFATPAPTKGGPAALVLSPKTSRALRRRRTGEINGKEAPGGRTISRLL